MIVRSTENSNAKITIKLAPRQRHDTRGLKSKNDVLLNARIVFISFVAY